MKSKQRVPLPQIGEWPKQGAAAFRGPLWKKSNFFQEITGNCEAGQASTPARCYKCSRRTQGLRFDSFSFTMHSYHTLPTSPMHNIEKKLHEVPALPYRFCRYRESIKITRIWEFSDNAPSDNHILPTRLSVKTVAPCITEQIANFML